jgi:hypothetical protein
MKAILLALLLLGQQGSGVDLDAVLAKADKLLEEAKTAYEAAKAAGSASAFVEAGFKLEEARIKYLVLQEVGGPDKQKIAADRLRAVNQLVKLIHDGKVAVSGTRVEKSEEAPPPEPEVKPAPEPEKPPDVLRRHPMPENAQIKEAEKQVKDLFKEQYAKKAPADRVALARALLAQCAKAGNDPPSLYFMYGEAADICVQLCDPMSAIVIIDRFAQIFDIDIVAARYGAVTACAANAKTVENSDALTDALALVAEDLAAADQYDLAEKCANAGLTHARKTSNPITTARLTTRVRELAEAKTRFAGMKSVLETLARSKEDPAANSDMGQYLCYVKGNWDMGLRFLVRGGDPALKLLAEREIALQEPTDRVSIADGWWDLAEKEKSPLRKSQLSSHARDLYESALPGLTGIPQARVEKRLAEADTANLESVDLLKLIKLPGDAVRADASFIGRYLVCNGPDWGRIHVPYAPPEEYDVTVVLERLTVGGHILVGLAGGGKQTMAIFDGYNNSEFTGLDQIDGKPFFMNETTFKGKVIGVGKRVVIQIAVRKNKTTATVGGKKIIDFKGSPTRWNLVPQYGMPNSNTMAIGSWGGKFVVSVMTLTPVSGPGKKLR